MSKGCLLIVDDEPILLKRLRVLLEDIADEILTAEDGVKALELLAERKVDCVLCDINMPKINGVEVLKKLRTTNGDLPFIFYTGHGNQDLMLEAVKYGAYDFLNKPYLDGLEEVVHRGLLLGLGEDPLPLDDDERASDYRQLLKRISEET